MPAKLAAPLLALLLSGVLTVLTPPLLRWLPVPADEEEAPPPFSELDTAGFRWAVFVSTAVLAWLAFSLTPPGQWPAWAPLATLGTLLGLIDLRTTFLPLRLNHLAIVLAIAGAGAAAWLGASWEPLLWAGIGGAGAASAFWLLWRFTAGGLGFGDVRLAGLIGLVAGATSPPLVLWSFLLGSAAGAVWGGVLWWRRGRDGAFAYGPALLLGPYLALAVSWALRLG